MSDKKREQIVQDYLFTFSTPQGERVLKDIMKSYGGSTFSTDPLRMAFNEGKRYVYLSIITLMGEARRIASVQLEAETGDEAPEQ